MLSYGQAYYLLKDQLQSLYDERESAAIAHELMSHITALDKIQRLIYKEKTFTEAEQLRFDSAAEALLKGEPIQYVTGSSWFLGREFSVNNNVLIPRPETEELVQWIYEDRKMERVPLSILDIGTGSGCIAISLKLLLPFANVTAIDVSRGAMEVAKSNAAGLGADVNWIELDFLDPAAHNKLGVHDVIVSNPPYIRAGDKDSLHINVRNFEPALALFVPDDDRLVFYRAIAQFGKTHLNAGGAIYCETEATHALACRELFFEMGYTENAELRKDMHGNWRMLKTTTT